MGIFAIPLAPNPSLSPRREKCLDLCHPSRPDQTDVPKHGWQVGRGPCRTEEYRIFRSVVDPCSNGRHARLASSSSFRSGRRWVANTSIQEPSSWPLILYAKKSAYIGWKSLGIPTNGTPPRSGRPINGQSRPCASCTIKSTCLAVS